MAKSMPAPKSVTARGLPGWSSATSSDPTRVPPVVGMNVTLTEQLPPAGKFPQLLFAAKSPAVVMPRIARGEPLGLASVTVCGALVVPTVWPGKSTTVDPVKLTVWGLHDALSLTISAP